ncbi:MAG: ATP synthase F0 subunit C [Gemmataceae bacterium]|nr:ATP synthase F0 subunit C [Gemmataceae bacterium]
MRNLFLFLVAVVVVLAGVSPASAAEGAGHAAAVGMGLSVVGIGIGLGLIGYAALSGIARQPEQAGAIQGVMFIIAGLVEGAGIISLVLCLVTLFI